MKTTTLLIIDAQNDFHPGGSLAIPTAMEDSQRVAKLLTHPAMQIARVVATLDSHQKLHIGHPCFWTEAATGQHPTPFTIISAQDLRDGKYRPHPTLKLPVNLKEALDPAIFGDYTKLLKGDGTLDLTKYVIEYAERLEAKGRFQICVWPEHCLIGSKGHAIVDPLQQAIAQWSESTGGSVEWIWKGQQLLTEMYSAMEADVPVTSDTAMNAQVLESLVKTDELIVCGQAMSHCVNYTLRDIVAYWPKDRLADITLLTDGASAVPGFETWAEQFQGDMRKAGVQLKSVAQVLGEE